MIQIDIDMPKTCDDCPFHIYHSGRNYVCVATPLFYPMNLANYKGGRKDFCPLKEVSQEPRWIPVSEKLPEPFTFVNATCRSLVDDRENWVIETVYVPIPKEVNKHGYSDWGNIPMLNWGEAEVIAWVERIIPQPYKAESEDKE